ncbi:NADH-quinone oxidoreductase subunit C [Candidatus Woesearchaeota archaeon]|nr:NADH-quinone oxidoreductase subunit C [Candidatus Woesearchaeota archaeon]
MAEIMPIIAELEKRFAVTHIPLGGVPSAPPGQPAGQPAPPAQPAPQAFSVTEPIVKVDPKKILAVCSFLAASGFDYLLTVTAADFPQRIEVLYFLCSMSGRLRLELKCELPRDKPEIDSVSGVWKAALYPEREVYDLFGIKFKGHPDLRRIFLEDEFEGYPLRKDYTSDFLVKMPEVGFR